MTNDSTRKPKRTPARGRALPPVLTASVETGAHLGGEFIPATDVAHARHRVEKQAVSDEEDQRFLPETMPNVAQARHVSRSVIYREGDMEYMIANGKRLYLDTYIGKEIGVSRPRDLRKTVARAIERGDIAPNQYVATSDDEVTRYYVDSEAAVLLAFNSNAGDKKRMVMRVVGRIRGVEETDKAIMSQKDALAGWDRVISFMAKKDVPRAAKLAKLPLLECYALAAGRPMPDVSDLIGPDQPRLEGV